MSERRKLQKLQEDLEEAEKNQRRLERRNEKLERDYKELEAKYEQVVQTTKPSVSPVPSVEAVQEKLNMERKIVELQTEVGSLRSDLQATEQKLAETQKNSRAALFREVDQTGSRRDLEKQLEELKRQLENKNQEIQQIKQEYEDQLLKEKRNGRRVVGRVRDSKGNKSALDALNVSIQTDPETLAKEIQQLRLQLSQSETAIEKQSKVFQRQIRDIEEKYQDSIASKERIEKRFIFLLPFLLRPLNLLFFI